MNVLVTGGTGFVGRAVVECLLAAGHRVTVLARHPREGSARLFARQPSLEVRAGDVTQPSAVAEAMTGMDCVVHLVGIIAEGGRVTFERVHVQGTLNTVRAAQQAGVGRFVHMSALGTRPKAVSRYHQTKWEAEELVRSSGLAFTIFRPSLIYGPGDQFVNLFARIIRRSPVVPLVGRRDARFAPVPIRCVAKAFAGAVFEPAALGQTYDLCGPEALTLRQIVLTIASVLGRKCIPLQEPSWLAFGQAMVLEGSFRVLGKPPPLSQDQLLMLQEDNAGDLRWREELFGPKPEGFGQELGQYLRSA